MRYLSSLVVALVVLFFAVQAHAQASRTWVSGVGDDVNPCSRTAPCKTWPGAISKTANHGEIDALDSGGFGTLTITKSMTIDGAGVNASILNAAGTGVIVNALTTDHVYIKNISINGFNAGINGIRIIQAASVTIENVTIYNHNGSNARGILINPSNTSVRVNVINTTIQDISGMGIESIPSGINGSVSLSLDGVRIHDVTQSAIDLDNNTKANIARSTITNNTIAGLFVERATCTADVYNTVIANNAEGIDVGVAGGGVVRLFASQVTGNTSQGILILAGTVATHQNNSIVGNGGVQATNLPLNTQ